MDINAYLEKMLVSKGLVTKEQVEKVASHMSGDTTLADIIVREKLVSDDKVLQILSDYYEVPYVDLKYYEVDKTLTELIPREMATKYLMLPLFKIRHTLMLAMANPSAIHVLDEIRIRTTLSGEPVLALPSTLRDTINRLYSVSDTMTDVIETIDDEDIGVERERESALIEAADDAPIVKLVNLFISQAVREKASDLHINPEEHELLVRYRVDGMLHEVARPPKKFEAALISRIKILANIDIAERRKPQDGRIKMRVDNKIIDIRVSTFPTIFGENVVMRLLDASSEVFGLSEIGLMEDHYAVFQRIIKRPYGIVLVTGPTGSGKTTTLYSALKEVNAIDKNIITLEDPVEYNLKLIRQAQVNPKADFTFANGLRAILRQDPDIVMVGEIRDPETARIATEAALTGHLVLSTLHTNDSVGTIARLTEMGVEHFLIASSLAGIMAQRLIRKICEKCKEEYVPPIESLQEIGITPGSVDRFYRGAGCDQCFHTGYNSRVGIFELLEIDEEISEAILHNKTPGEIKEIARKQGMLFLRDDGIRKVKKGASTIEEVLRVTKES